ncbi:MAG: protein phosphatase CheZ [Pseudomonadota bacterium]|jgi:chemotaxis protein CheZ
MTAENDSLELEALFDSVAASVAATQTAPAAPPPLFEKAGNDSDDLQALFDSVAATYNAPGEAPAAAAPSVARAPASAPVPHPAKGEGDEHWDGQEAVFNRIGQLARTLHDSLMQLGYDKLLEKTVSAIPDAKDRLAYVANLTEQAACRVLNATDIAKPVVDDIESSSRQMGKRWDDAFANRMTTPQFRQLAEETRTFLNQGLPAKAATTNAQLLEIMMAQDFQDLTGQVIKKIVGLAQELESGLMSVLVEIMPDARRSTEVDSLLNGPVITSEGRSDVVVNQQQVDDLLDSLGF